MMDWWSGLTALNKAFYGVAAFFSVIFVWQFISALIGLAGGDMDADADVHADVDAGGADLHTDADMDGGLDAHGLEAHSAHDAGESLSAFRVLSVRAILAFCTLFSWATALYLNQHETVTVALLYATGWGLAGGVVVTFLVRWLRGLAETGTPRLSTCVGARGTVYMDIPAGGRGEVRVPVGGVLTMVKARAAGGEAIKAGIGVYVLGILDEMTVEVRPFAPEADA
jgi:hypothetical protein